jgi:hypothetical protein
MDGRLGLLNEEEAMVKVGSTLAILGLCAAVAACQTTQQSIGNKEDMMAAAGFKFVPANTPARQASFKNLPPHKFSREIKNGQVFYVYPDPTVCVCLYVGNQSAYARYQGNVFQKNLADEQQMTANINSMNDWDWGPWGGYPYPGWYY